MTHQSEYLARGFPAGDAATSAPAYGDSTDTEIVWTDYLVMAHGTVPGEIWLSEVAAAYSVENLAPGAPLNLAASAQYADVRLGWAASEVDDEDLSLYRVYRGDAPGFPLDPAHFQGSASDTTYLDVNPGNGDWYYRVAGLDASGNEGDASNEAAAEIATAVDGAGSPTALTLLGAYPNPFNPSTRIDFDLPTTGMVALEILDVSGRRIALLHSGRLASGLHAFEWNGKDSGGQAVAGGIYLARLRASGGIQTAKLTLLK